METLEPYINGQLVVVSSTGSAVRGKISRIEEHTPGHLYITLSNAEEPVRGNWVSSPSITAYNLNTAMIVNSLPAIDGSLSIWTHDPSSMVSQMLTLTKPLESD